MPAIPWIKLAGIAALVAGGAYISWELRSASAEKEKTAAVAAAVKDMEGKILEERFNRAYFQDLADKRLTALTGLITNIKVEHRTIVNNIQNEVAANPEFYRQPLTPGGYDQWKRARALVAPTSPASSASSSVSP